MLFELVQDFQDLITFILTVPIMTAGATASDPLFYQMRIL
jgi:hypothetical protein